MMSRDKAWELVQEHIEGDNIRYHSLATEALMRALARKFGEDEDRWGIAGMLHDLDWDYTKPTPEVHGLKSYELLKDEDLDEEMLNAIKIHNEMIGIEPVTLLEKALHSTEMMTGFIVAVTLVRPSKKIADVKVKSIMKKFKDKGFGAGANRDIMRKVEPYLGMEVRELAEICLGAMQGISDEIGL
jgi:uncharacterized protein